MPAPPDDEESTPPVPARRIGHPDNRQLLAVVGNFRLEAQEHTRGLQRIYDTLVGLTEPAPVVFGPQLLDEMERHHAKNGANIAALAALVTR